MKKLSKGMVIAGAWSGVGKTTISIGLMSSFIKKGLIVQPFKVGPDYIDPSYHYFATKRCSRNLDLWMIAEDGIKEIFYRASKNADVSIVEGVMGLYDGSALEINTSTSKIAEILNLPVILIIDVTSMGESVSAVAKGFSSMSKNFAGVILNKVSSDSHKKTCIRALENENIEVFGAIPKEEGIILEKRHLGLIPGFEKDFNNKIQKISRIIEECIDLERILDLSEISPEINYFEEEIDEKDDKKYAVKIGVAFDKAFNFYYWDNLDLLMRLGADLKFFSPVRDKQIDVDGLYIGGGFPEIYANELTRNKKMLNLIKELSEEKIPIYGECGGLLYLTNEIEYSEKRFEMVGVFNASAKMKDRVTLNYTKGFVIEDNILSRKGDLILGHEFHYTEIDGVPKNEKFVYKLTRGKGITSKKDGWLVNNTLGSYSHLHFYSNKNFAKNFIERCREFA